MKKPVVLTRQELYERVWSKPMSVLAREFGVTGNALAKICDRTHVPYPSRGHWAKAAGGKAPERVPLPPTSEQDAEPITISGVRATSRRVQTRMSREARREQLITVAADILMREGAHAASMKRIAREAGVSETQAYNYFKTQAELLVELARRELRAQRDTRQTEIDRGNDHYSRLALSIRGYLKHVQQRGALLQMLLCNPEVRLLLRENYRARRSGAMNRHAEHLVETFGVSRPVALACTVVLTAVSLRTGKLVANKKISAEAGERLAVAITAQGSRDTISAARTALLRA
jgi:AcrR family transcriptional regulator